LHALPAQHSSSWSPQAAQMLLWHTNPLSQLPAQQASPPPPQFSQEPSVHVLSVEQSVPFATHWAP
jgi:hypothetical protein